MSEQSSLEKEWEEKRKKFASNWHKLGTQDEIETLIEKVASLEKKLDEMSKDSFALIEEAKKVERERIIQIVKTFPSLDTNRLSQAELFSFFHRKLTT